MHWENIFHQENVDKDPTYSYYLCLLQKKMHLHSTGGQSYHKHPQVRLCAFSQAVAATPLAYVSLSMLSSHSCLKWVYQLLLFFAKYESSHHRMIWLSQVPGYDESFLRDVLGCSGLDYVQKV